MEKHDVSARAIATAKAKNDARIAARMEAIDKRASNEGNIVNVLAVEIAKMWIERREVLNECIACGVNPELDREYITCDDELGRLLMQLGTILAQAKLKRLNSEDDTYSPIHAKSKREIATATDENGVNRYNQWVREYNSLYHYEYDSRGEYVQVCDNKAQAREISKKMSDIVAYGDSMDLVSEAYASLIEDLDAMPDDCYDEYWLLGGYTKVIESSTVYKNGDPKDPRLFQYTATNAINESTSAISKCLAGRRSVHDNEVGYDEAVTEVCDPLTGRVFEVRKYMKSARVFRSGFSSDGKATYQYLVYDVGFREVDELFAMVSEKAGFTAIQKKVFEDLYRNGRTREWVIDHRDITRDVLDSMILREIYPRCRRVFGIEDPEALVTGNPKIKVAVFKKEDLSHPLDTFESLGDAARAFGIDKGNASKVLKGERKSVGGLVFVEVKD